MPTQITIPCNIRDLKAKVMTRLFKTLCLIFIIAGLTNRPAPPADASLLPEESVQYSPDVEELLIESRGVSRQDKGKSRLDELQHEYALDMALINAAKEGNKNQVARLLSAGADLNAKDEQGRTVLHHAAGKGSNEMVCYLLKAGAKIESKDKCDQTPLHLAAMSGNKAVAESLIGADAYVDAKDCQQNTPLHYAAGRKIAQLLLSKRADINAQNHYQHTPLFMAAEDGNKKLVEFLISRGANVNTICGLEGTALHVAVARGHKEIAKELIISGAGVNIAAGKGGSTPLIAAVLRGNKDMIKLLLDRGAKVGVRDWYDRTALDYAGHIDYADAKIYKMLKAAYTKKLTVRIIFIIMVLTALALMILRLWRNQKHSCILED